MIYRSLLAAAACGSVFGIGAPEAQAQDYIGEVKTVAFNFCPRSTMEADGRLLPISSHTALFSLLGTMYGGDGRSTFALPDLRGRTVIGAGTGPGLSPRQVGQKGGMENHSTNNPSALDDGEGEVMGDSTTGENMPPFLAMKQCVVTEGIYPPRS